jgi:hypothetical protein
MKFRLSVTGETPLLMHNARLSDPLDEFALKMKRVSGKRKKTEDDHREMGDLEFLGGIYHDDQLGPYIPAQNFERCLIDAAKKVKLGSQLKPAMVITTEVNPLAYSGPRDLEGLMKDENFRHRASAKVGMQRIMRVRPHFREWSTYTVGELDTEQLDLVQLKQIVEIAGKMIGLGDWRPRFGRFTGSVEQVA